MKKRMLAIIAAVLALAAYRWFAWWLMYPPPKASSLIPEWTPAEKRWVQ